MLQKGKDYAKILSYMSQTISFNWKVVMITKKGIAYIKQKGDREPSCLEYDVKSGEEVNGRNSTRLVSHKEGIKLVKEGRVSLDGGESLPVVVQKTKRASVPKKKLTKKNTTKKVGKR
jgi:hypothetical protein